jgi:hypothetical protein
MALLIAVGSRSAETVSVRTVEALEGEQTVVKIHLSAPLPGAPRGRLLPKGAGQPDRLAVDLPGADLHGKPSKTVAVGWGGVQRMRLGRPDAVSARLVLDLDRPVAFDLRSDGPTIEVTLRPRGRAR